MSHVITGMECARWAEAVLVVFALIGVRFAGGLRSATRTVKAVILNAALAIMVLVALHFGPISNYRYSFDRFVQPPSESLLEF